MSDEWQTVRFQDCCDLVKSKSDPLALSAETAYVGLEHFTPSVGRLTDVGFSTDVSSLVSVFEADDVLFGRLRPYLKKVAIADFGGVCSPEVLVLRARQDVILPGFLFLVASSDAVIDHAVALSAGSRMPRTSFADLGSCELLLPPLSVQRQIVDLIKHLDNHIANLTEEVRNADIARDSLAEEMLTSLGGDTATLGSLLQIARGGSPRPIDRYFTTAADGLNWIKIGDVSATGKYITQTAQKISPEGLSKTREVHVGDFLLSNSMSFGRPYILKIDGCIHDGWLVLSDEKELFDKDFLFNLLRSRLVQEQFSSLAAGSGVKNLNISVVESVTVSIPSKTSQASAVAFINDFEDTISALEGELNSLKTIRQQLLSNLLSGFHSISNEYDQLMEATAY